MFGWPLHEFKITAKISRFLLYQHIYKHHLPTGGAELQKVVQWPRAVINNLKPHTNYTFYVMAYNDRGASRHSDRVTEVTDEDCKSPSYLCHPKWGRFFMMLSYTILVYIATCLDCMNFW